MDSGNLQVHINPPSAYANTSTRTKVPPRSGQKKHATIGHTGIQLVNTTTSSSHNHRDHG